MSAEQEQEGQGQGQGQWWDALYDSDVDSDDDSDDDESYHGSDAGAASEDEVGPVDPAGDAWNNDEYESSLRDIRITMTAYKPSAWPALVGREPRAAETLAAVRALDDAFPGVHFYEDVPTDGGRGLGVRWAFSSLERFQKIVDALNASVLTSLAIDFGGDLSDGQPEWQTDCMELLISQLDVPTLEYLDLGCQMIPDEILEGGTPDLLRRCPIAHATWPTFVKPSYGPVWSPLISESESTSLVTFCVHGARLGRQSVFEPAWSGWCSCGLSEDDASNKWPKKWMMPLSRNRYIAKATRRAVFGTFVAARLLFTGTKAEEDGQQSILDLPPEVRALIAAYASPEAWTLTRAQVASIIATASDRQHLRDLVAAVNRTEDSSVVPIRDAWLVDNGLVYRGDAALATAQFAAYQKRPKPRARRRR